MNKEEKNVKKEEELFFSLGSNQAENQKLIEKHADVYGDLQLMSRSTANTSRTFVGHDPNFSVKSDYTRDDYERFRTSERVPTQSKEIMNICNKAYKRVGIVRNVIDLMGDFATKGIRLQHTNPSIQKFFNQWFKKVNGKERSERFLNNLYRLGNVVVNRSNGKLTKKVIEVMKKSEGAINSVSDIDLIDESVYKNKILPLKYTFINPISIEEKNPALASFTGKKTLCIRLNSNLKNEIVKIKNQTLELYSIPKFVRDAISRGEDLIELEKDKMSVYHYKKDDWEDWADPITYSILDNLLTLEKMNLADLSALDGAISNIRLWTLGIFDGPNNSIMPTKAGIAKLRNILANNVGGGTIDLVYGPELKFTESNTNVHQFLGSEKYTVTFDLIYDGLGIPSALRSGGSNTSSSTGHIALKTLIERLQYGRDVLTTFWEQEVGIVCKAMGFKEYPHIAYDQMVLSDEAAEKQLFLNLVDRDIVSNSTLLEKFDIAPHIESARVNSESRKRGKSRPLKASPFHNAQLDHDFKKIILQNGGIAPSELGIKLEERKKGEKSAMELEAKYSKKVEKTNLGTDGAGRPKNVTETNKRKPKPSGKTNLKAGSASFVDIFLWANSAQKEISDIVVPKALINYGKKNVRSLSKEQFDELEQIKAGILFSISPYDDINEELVYNSLTNNKSTVEDIKSIQVLSNRFALNNNRMPNTEELREITSSAYALIFEE